MGEESCLMLIFEGYVDLIQTLGRQFFFSFSVSKTLFCHFMALLDSLEKSVINLTVKFFVWISWGLLCLVVLWASCIRARSFHQIYETPGCNFLT